MTASENRTGDPAESKHLNKNETIMIPIFQSVHRREKKLYIFLITKDRLEFLEKELDSLFIRIWLINRSIKTINLQENRWFIQGLYSFSLYCTKSYQTCSNRVKWQKTDIIPMRRLLVLLMHFWKQASSDQWYEGLHTWSMIMLSFDTLLLDSEEPYQKKQLRLMPFFRLFNWQFSTNNQNLKDRDWNWCYFQIVQGKDHRNEASESNFRKQCSMLPYFIWQCIQLADSSNSSPRTLCSDPRKRSSQWRENCTIWRSVLAE